MPKLKISNSALDLYQTCPRKFKFKYIENLKGDFTATPLLFGSAIDAALNYILESIRDKKEWSSTEAQNIFIVKMHEWTGNPLSYFKNEIPENINGYASEEEAVFDNLLNRGPNLIGVYINDVLPLIDTVVSVQDRFEVPNEDGDVFTGVIDFIAKLKDGRTVLLDNKTASSKYIKKAVVQSQQLSLYIDQFPDLKYAGYIVLIKNPAKEKGMTHQIMVDEIPEETKAEAYKLLDETMQNIKEEKFPCNFKGCKAFGKTCEYERACSYNDYTGLVPNRVKDLDEDQAKALDIAFKKSLNDKPKRKRD